jgi:hypothetical protein
MNHQLMNPRTILSTTIAVGSAMFLGTSLILSAATSPSVTGSISFYQGPDIMHLDFQAVQNDDGTVTGQAHNSLNDGPWMPLLAHLRLDCMLFLDEHTVIVGGEDVWDSDPTAGYLGNRVVFVVQDNGQEADSEPDRIGGGVIYDRDFPWVTDCESLADWLAAHPLFWGNFSLPALTGNIQVRP